MIILDRDQELHDTPDLSLLLEHPDNFTEYDAGVLRSKDVFMTTNHGSVYANQEDHQPTFFVFDSRYKEIERWRALWDGGKDEDVPWLGAELLLHDSTADRLSGYSLPVVDRLGTDTRMVVRNAIRIGGLSGKGSGGSTFRGNPVGSTNNFNCPLTFSLPGYWMLENESHYQPTQEKPRQTYLKDASHMYIGYDSMMQGLGELEQCELRDFVFRYFGDLPNAEKAQQRLYDSRVVRRSNT